MKYVEVITCILEKLSFTSKWLDHTTGDVINSINSATRGHVKQESRAIAKMTAW